MNSVRPHSSVGRAARSKLTLRGIGFQLDDQILGNGAGKLVQLGGQGRVGKGIGRHLTGHLLGGVCRPTRPEAFPVALLRLNARNRIRDRGIKGDLGPSLTRQFWLTNVSMAIPVRPSCNPAQASAAISRVNRSCISHSCIRQRCSRWVEGLGRVHPVPAKVGPAEPTAPAPA